MRDRVRKRAESHSKGQSTVSLPDGMERMQVEKGSNVLSIIPYEVAIKDHPEGARVGDYWYEKTFGIHYGVGPMEKKMVCPAMTAGKPCPVCEEQAKLRKDPDADEDTVKALRPKERQLFNVVDVKDDKATIKILEMSYHLFGKQLEEEVQQEDDLAGFADVEGGKIIRVRFKKKKLGKNDYLEADRFDFKDRGDLSEDILEQALDLDTLVQVPSYKEIKKEFEGSTSDDEDDDEDSQDDAGDDTDDGSEEQEWEKGDRVVVDIDGEDYAGTIKKIKGEDAKIEFDDGDIDTYSLEDCRAEEKQDDDTSEDEEEDEAGDEKGSGDDFEDWNFDDKDEDEDEDEEKKTSTRRRRRG